MVIVLAIAFAVIASTSYLTSLISTIELSLRRLDRGASICQGNCSATSIQVFDPAMCRDHVNGLNIKKVDSIPIKAIALPNPGRLSSTLSIESAPANRSCDPAGARAGALPDRMLTVIGRGRLTPSPQKSAPKNSK